jgi:uncharacterized protein YbcI
MTDTAPKIESGGATGDGDDHGTVLLAISNAIVRLYKRYYGKGPTQARAYYQDDLVTCVLRDVYTRAERTLIESGRVGSVLSQRSELQQAIRDEFIAEIERVTGRQVLVFFSASHEGPDMCLESFLLGTPLAAARPPG